LAEIKLKTGKICENIASRAGLAAIIISAALLLWTVFFLYNNFYQSLNDVRILTTLKNQVATKTVDIKTWETISRRLAEKKQPMGEWDLKYMPF